MNPRYAGFWIRLVAFLIDIILIGIVDAIIISIVQGLFSSSIFLTAQSTNTLNPQISSQVINTAMTIATVNFITIIALEILYFVIYQSKAGQTIGKKVMNIKVVMSDGNKPTMLIFFLREIIGKFVSGIILNIGYLMAAWDSKKQALHDKIANTYVVYVEPAAAPAQTVPVQQQTVPAQQQTAQQTVPVQQVGQQQQAVNTSQQAVGEPQQQATETKV